MLDLTQYFMIYAAYTTDVIHRATFSLQYSSIFKGAPVTFAEGR